MYFDKYGLRDKNERIVLESLMANQPLSRVDLSKITHLNKATITNIINTFIDRKLINEIGFGVSHTTGGRRPILLEMNRNAGTAISIDVGNDYIRAIMTDLNGTVLAHYETATQSIDASNIYTLVDEIVNAFTAEASKTIYGIVAMVLAIHGVVFENHITVAPNYNLIGLNLHETLSKKYTFPVLLENEANLAALGHISGSHEVSNAVLLSIHTGIGAGIIIDRNLYTGLNGAAGEVGHLTLYPSGKPCRCGRQGCLEQYCSSKVIYDAFHELYPQKTMTHNLLVDAYETNPGFAMITNQAMRDLATGLNTIIASFNPEIIYIVSDVITAIPSLLTLLSDTLQNDYNYSVPLMISDIAPGATLFGGASLGIAEFLGTERFTLMRHEVKNNN